MSKIKNKIKNNVVFAGLIFLFRKLFRVNIIKGYKRNTIRIGSKGIIKGVCIKIDGIRNVLEIKNPTTNLGLNIFIKGNNNHILIEENCVLKNLSIWIEDDNNRVFIGKNTLICGDTKLSCIEGKSICIGNECMFSDGIDVRTGDSHSVLDEKDNRINPSKDVVICDHCWVGHGVSILKGCTIEKNSIVATKSVVTKSFNKEGVIIAGNPAKIVKENINWDKARLSTERDNND